MLEVWWSLTCLMNIFEVSISLIKIFEIFWNLLEVHWSLLESFEKIEISLVEVFRSLEVRCFPLDQGRSSGLQDFKRLRRTSSDLNTVSRLWKTSCTKSKLFSPLFNTHLTFANTYKIYAKYCKDICYYYFTVLETLRLVSPSDKTLKSWEFNHSENCILKRKKQSHKKIMLSTITVFCARKR